MGDLFEEGLEWLAEELKAFASKSVMYRRGNDEVALQAVVGRTLLKLDDGFGGVRMVWTDRDYLIEANDLMINGSTVLPRRGDRIVADDGTYEVLAPGGEPEWRWSDPCHRILRIHTKKVS